MNYDSAWKTICNEVDTSRSSISSSAFQSGQISGKDKLSCINTPSTVRIATTKTKNILVDVLMFSKKLTFKKQKQQRKQLISNHEKELFENTTVIKEGKRRQLICP